MDSDISISTAPPESSAPFTTPSDPSLLGKSTDPVAPPADGEKTQTAELNVAGEKVEGVQVNQKKHRPYVRRGRFPFKGRHGRNGRGRMRWQVDFRRNFHNYPFWVDSRAIQFHGGNGQHWTSTIVGPSHQQLFPAQQLLPSEAGLSTTGAAAAAMAPPSVKASFSPQISHLPLSWCDVCRVDCSSPEVLEKHKTGKRHKKTVQLLEKLEGRVEPVGELIIDNYVNLQQHGESINPLIEDVKVKEPIETSMMSEPMHSKCSASARLKKKRKKNSEPEQSHFCVLCNAACNSQAMFEAHLAGKKHAIQLCRFQTPNTFYGLLSDYIPPPNQSSTSSLTSQGTRTLYYGLMNLQQPHGYAALNPHLEPAYGHGVNTEGQHGFTGS